MKNRTLKLFGTKWKVVYKDQVLNEENKWLYGSSNLSKKIIEISTKDYEGVPLSQEDIELTFYHELMHAIFSTGQYNSCCDDEPLVEWVARCIQSLKNQKVL